jgi:magnesium chelatase family protein
MLSQVFSAAVIGVDAYEVEIEVNTASSVKTLVVVVGLPDVAVKEGPKAAPPSIWLPPT